MKAILNTMLGLVIAMGSYACSAQDPLIPFKQIEHDSQLYASLILRAGAGIENNFLGATAADPAAATFAGAAPKAVRRTLGPKYFLFNGLHLGMAVFDVEMTQQCIAAHHCREGNPLMPSSHAGQIGVNLAFVGYGSFVSYWLRKRGSRMWWISPAIGTVAHGAGLATGIAHQ